MSNRALRFALASAALAAILGAAYVMWKTESEGTAAIGAARNFDARVRLASRSLLDIKGAQPGYVAAGQGEDFWTTRIDVLLPVTRDALTALRSQAQLTQTRNEIDAAATAFEDFEQMDRRARDYVSGGQRLLASDLVFSDGIEKVDAAVAALDRARELESNALNGASRARRRRQLAAAAGAAAASMLVVMMLAPVPKRWDPAATVVAKPSIVEPAANYPVRPLAAGTMPAVPPPSTLDLRSAVRSEAPATTPAIDLPAVAALCTDLGRVLDTRALPAALERAATVLDAAGIVVWIADPDGRELAPIVAHGYPQNLVARLGTIAHDAENVTAAAFRTGLVQTVKADTISHGAIAAPLLAPGGPVGVMAAEVRNQGERQDATRAAAAIIAAQLAALMGPPSSRNQARATEAAGA